MFKKATKVQAKLRLALIGPSGSGKTYSSMNIAQYLGEKVAVIDTERGSASKYADIFDFDVNDLESFHPQKYIDSIKEAEAAGYDVLIIDSLSHAWMGKDGALELVDKVAKRSQSQNTFNAWREVTPIHNSLVDAILQSRMHVIVTMRAKTEYVLETNEKGKQVPRKVGIAPVQRDGLEYEFDVVADMDLDTNMIVSKTRCSALTGALINKPGRQVADVLRAWLTDGSPAVEPAHEEQITTHEPTSNTSHTSPGDKPKSNLPPPQTNKPQVESKPIPTDKQLYELATLADVNLKEAVKKKWDKEVKDLGDEEKRQVANGLLGSRIGKKAAQKLHIAGSQAGWSEEELKAMLKCTDSLTEVKVIDYEAALEKVSQPKTGQGA